MRVKARIFVAVVCVGMVVTTAVGRAQRGGQTGPTEAQARSAAIEVPRLVEALELEAGMTVADIGAGFGAWTAEFARVLGPSGRVFSTDIGEPQLEALRARVAGGLANVTVVEGSEGATNLPPGCCDAMLIRDAYHHLTQPAEMIRSMAAALRPGGRLAVIDFPPRPDSAVPDGVPANRGGHGVPMDVVSEEVTAAGFRVISATPDWSAESQPAGLFLLVFAKP